MAWAFQVSLLSTIMPKNLADSFDGTLWLPIMRGRYFLFGEERMWYELPCEIKELEFV